MMMIIIIIIIIIPLVQHIQELEFQEMIPAIKNLFFWIHVVSQDDFILQ
jgi:hypothetical protein